MSTVITTINSTDLITNSRTDINNNFASLNTNKIETSVISTDSTLSADSDALIPSQAAVKTYVDAGGSAVNLQRLLPTGTMLPYGAAAAPSYFLLCDGSAVSRSIYAALYAVIGTTYGAGNGSTTFNVPDARGRVIVGSGTGVKIATISSVAGNVFTVTGLTNNANNEFVTGQAVVFTAGVPGNLVTATTYYVVAVTATTFSLATTLTNAQNDIVITLAGTETGSFALTFTARTVGDTGGEENHAMSATEILSHTHVIAGHTSSGSNGGVGGDNGGGTFNQNTGGVGGNVAMNNEQPFVVAAWIIKT